MDWTNVIQRAIEFMEENITEEITAETVADHVHISSFYFQKGFSMLCGYSVMVMILLTVLQKHLQGFMVYLLLWCEEIM